MSAANGIKSIKRTLRSWHKQVRLRVARAFFAYSRQQLLGALRKLGVRPGDAIMVHSAFEAHHGFQGTLGDAIDVFMESVGPNGHLLMPSMAYHSSTLDYLTQLKSFDVRRVPSAMGLMTEFFRRRPGVIRSVSPSHPILVSGPRAQWFVAGHEHALHPCGPGTPFERLLEENGKVVFFNVPFAYFTFFHYLEHHVASHLKFPLYHQPPFSVPTISAQGEALTVTTCAYSREALKRRRFPLFEAEMRRRNLIRRVRVGASYLLIAEVRAAVAAVDEMVHAGRFFYDMTDLQEGEQA